MYSAGARSGGLEEYYCQPPPPMSRRHKLAESGGGITQGAPGEIPPECSDDTRWRGGPWGGGGWVIHPSILIAPILILCHNVALVGSEWVERDLCGETRVMYMVIVLTDTLHYGKWGPCRDSTRKPGTSRTMTYSKLSLQNLLKKVHEQTDTSNYLNRCHSNYPSNIYHSLIFSISVYAH